MTLLFQFLGALTDAFSLGVGIFCISRGNYVEGALNLLVFAWFNRGRQ